MQFQIDPVMQPLIQAQPVAEGKVIPKVNDVQQKTHQRRKSKTPDNTPDHKVLTTSESRESNHYIKNKAMQSPTSRGRVCVLLFYIVKDCPLTITRLYLGCRWILYLTNEDQHAIKFFINDAF